MAGQKGMKLLHIAQDEPNERVWTPLFRKALATFVDVEVAGGGRALSDEAAIVRMARCDVLLTGWGSRPVPEGLARNRGSLAYVCHVTGEMRRTIPLALIDAGVPVTNWGDAPAQGIAEGAMALLLGLVKNLRGRIRAVEEDRWHLAKGEFTGTLHRMAVGVYGCGLIGRRFVDALRPFGAEIAVYDPYLAEPPDGCRKVDSLDELFRSSEAVVIHAGLTDETRGSVNAERLAMLPDNGIVVNTARGGIVDQEALFVELEKGRLMAGIDVLDPDRPLPEGHPARRWPNAIFTGHTIGTWGKGGRERESLAPWHEVCLDNVRRFRDGEPLRFRMDRERYLLST